MPSPTHLLLLSTQSFLLLAPVIHRALHHMHYGYVCTAYGLYTGSSTSHLYHISQSWIVSRYGTGRITVTQPYLQYKINYVPEGGKRLYGCCVCTQRSLCTCYPLCSAHCTHFPSCFPTHWLLPRHCCVYASHHRVLHSAVAMLTPHRLIEFTESSTMIFATSLLNCAIGFRIFDVTGFCMIDEGEICDFNLIVFCVDVRMGFSCIVMHVSDLIGFCKKGFFWTIDAVGVWLCAIKAKVDIDELKFKVVVVLVILHKSQLEGWSVLRFICVYQNIPVASSRIQSIYS